jgi:transcriptional antiterminator NusG
MIYVVKTVVGRENIVIDAIASKAKTQNLQIQALMHPEEIKGYIFIEGDVKEIEKALQMIPHVRGLIKTPVDLKEIQKFLQPKLAEIELGKGDIVEVIGGPFKGEKGKVIRYDKVKREIVIEMLEVSVPIPVTVSAEFVKLVEKASE